MRKMLVLFATVGLLVSQANGVVITYNANTDGTTAPPGTTFTATGGSLATKTVAGWTALGVSGGFSGNEIDPGQMLTVTFDTPVALNYLTLALLFDGPEFGDVNETAGVRVNGLTEYKLTATGTTTATWTGSGTVVNLSPSDENNAAVWRIDNPFSSGGITTLEFYPVSSNPTGNDSDFGLQGFQAVPDLGSTISLLGAAVGALAVFRRRRA